MTLVPNNSNGRKAERMEIAASYRMSADSIFSGFNGDLAFRGSATNYTKDMEDGGIPYVLPNDRIGNNFSGGLPHWKYQVQALYSLDRFSTHAHHAWCELRRLQQPVDRVSDELPGLSRRPRRIAGSSRCGELRHHHQESHCRWRSGGTWA